jgi:large subunit ribosomal protein L6
MSRIGRKPISIPSGVDVTVTGGMIKVKGPKGELTQAVPPHTTITVAEGVATITRENDEPEVRALHGLTRALLQNMVTGVTKGYEKRLEIIGVGYRAQATATKITLNIGYSHPVELEVPKGLKVEFDKEAKNIMIVSGIDKQLVGSLASKVRSLRPPEPYLGKGIRYVGEYVPRKAGKAVAGKAE